MDQLIKNVVAGDTPTLLDAEKANELINAINAFRKLTVSPQGLGKITIGEQNVVIDLTPLKQLFDQLSTVVSGFTASPPPGGGGGGGGGGSSTQVVTTINAIISGLSSMTLTLACDPVTRVITGTINLVLPPTL